MERLEETAGKRFGDPADPLLVSVRSGAAVSMPGMMDTILNLGLNDEAVEGLARATGNDRFAFDAYRRLVQMFGDVVAGVDGQLFERELAALKNERGVTEDVELGADDLRELVGSFGKVYAERSGSDFPQDAREQLAQAVRAVFDSWETPRAQVYRRANGIPDDLGTAVNVVQMVFGNKGDDSGTGVAFTRDPSTGEPGLWGEILVNAQGEDVVAGIRTPEPIAAMQERFPAAFEQLSDDDGAARGALPRDAGHRVHRRGGHALPAADAHREADGCGRAAHRDRHGRRRAAHAGRRRSRGSTRRSSTSSSTR